MKKEYSFNKRSASLLCFFFFIFYSNLSAQEKTAKIELSFVKKNDERTCIARVTGDSVPLKGLEIHFYIKSFFGLFPFGETTETDSNGIAEVVFPDNLPGDSTGKVMVIAKIEDDQIYGSVETKAGIRWGVLPHQFVQSELFPEEKFYSWERSLSASREKAPIFLIVSSIIIILLVWGTIGYVIVHLFKIKKEG